MNKARNGWQLTVEFDSSEEDEAVEEVGEAGESIAYLRWEGARSMSGMF